ncbi:Metalloprotease m41 ftsh isoform 1 [Dorcoceras hygrometricum]|uniref:Metalloprotease m41 ftsh isoform 1 n=1 Tax=Dorcoceras hygrometricum TaxID=472368 RepID=A0A2Z7CRF3_9LAMI|nr:Metalloprotease m41 ftsh isoform 1 [Dorcoceras hygrometricum]
MVEEAKKSENEVSSAKVKEGLKGVKATKRMLQEEIMNDLYAKLRVLKGEKDQLMNRSKEIVEKFFKAKREEESLLRKAKSGGVRIQKLREERMSWEKEYNDIWERIDEIEDLISGKETMALSIGVRELVFLERECEALVVGFMKEVRKRATQSSSAAPLTKISKGEIQQELQHAHRQLQEQIILPSVLTNEERGSLSYHDATDFALRIQQVLRDSKKMQKNLEDHIKKTMKKNGKERRYIAITPADEVVKGFPDIELKWMFGRKEVIVPKAVGLHLLHGWKKWRDDSKTNLKRSLLEDPDLGKKYVAERQISLGGVDQISTDEKPGNLEGSEPEGVRGGLTQRKGDRKITSSSGLMGSEDCLSKMGMEKERILLDRDRVSSRSWFNEQRNRWELDPIAVPYAISKKLVEGARIRHDWSAMYVTLKGNDKEFFVDIKEFEMLFEDFGGFDALYLRMIAAGIPTAVQLMYIPFSELDVRQQFFLVLTMCRQCFTGLWSSNIVSHARKWTLEKIRNINDDIMMMTVFPVLEFIIPYQLRMRLGMAWPEYSDVSVGSTWYLTWQSEAETNFRSRKTDEFQWYFWFLIRASIYGYVVFHVIRYLKRKIPRILGFGPMRRDPNLRKLGRVRIKNPPIRLKDFASVESMKEEINEVVAFLRNPHAFREMGARAPRGVLIVGERGTGKTSLALAIAAEAKVPVVEVKAHQLEAGLWVGQSASNVRELFQTARDLAPVIILVEDFDLFAGVRGKFIHTKKQDHEAFINQLLVELDGFEKQDGVVLMATTRNVKQIDEALQRPGRMDRIFHLQRPTKAEREKILRIAAEETMDEDLIDFVDWRKPRNK